MKTVKITVLESRCRDRLCEEGDTFILDGRCPPLCQELWHAAYPYVFALQNGAALDLGDSRSTSFTCRCPDGGRVVIRGEII
ncbi:MAG: TIGR04076 family protein [Clostridia bacterium]|nr:TIGR04076 family protein [Clostridia bacterium]